MTHVPQVIGSIIGLKAEYREQYIALHRNTFPGVLKRIHQSKIGRYSIFLHKDLLFSYMEYHGDSYDADMKAIGRDQTTLDWWKLTDPMQLPVDGRKDGEWWATMNLVSGYSSDLPDQPLNRFAFIAGVQPGSRTDQGSFHTLHTDTYPGLQCIRVFKHEDQLYIYLEANPAFDISEFRKKVSGRIAGIGELQLMEEVFHTDPETDAETRAISKVFVTGCFDMLHSGHIAFLEEANTYGEVYVGIGSDTNVENLKGRLPINTQQERKYMLDALRCVKECRVNTGWGIMDFIRELTEIRPDYFIVNEDGHTPAKQKLCLEMGIRYKVLKRIPHSNLPVRSTTSLRTECTIPFRIDLAGGWLDQPFVSKFCPGSVITISIEPVINFNERSGMASSTRRKAIELWNNEIPHGDTEQLAKILFSFENPPGTKVVAGSQDSLGIVLPGLNRLDYNGDYWPEKIISRHDEDLISWIENSLYLVTLGPRVSSYNVLENTSITAEKAATLSRVTTDCWEAILRKDIHAFGDAFKRSFEAQVDMFPNMVYPEILDIIEAYKEKALGWKLSGAGGGGYLILVSPSPVDGAMQIRIRRREIIWP